MPIHPPKAACGKAIWATYVSLASLGREPGSEPDRRRQPHPHQPGPGPAPP